METYNVIPHYPTSVHPSLECMVAVGAEGFCSGVSFFCYGQEWQPEPASILPEAPVYFRHSSCSSVKAMLKVTACCKAGQHL